MLLSGIIQFNSFMLSGQPYNMKKPQGYAEGTTGGGKPTAENTLTVSNADDLKSALEGTKSVILVSGIIETEELEVTVVNKTILGLSGARLINLNQTKSGSGILSFKEGSKNVIIRNLIFEGPGAYDVDGADLITNKYCVGLWVDHCEFYDGVDDAFDNTGDADNITVSWCKFSYLKPPRPDGPGGSDDHRFANLIGGSDKSSPEDDLYSTTWMYNWWSNGVKDRMVRARNAEIHMLNNYWNSNAASSYITMTPGVYGASCYVENGVFAGSGIPSKDNKDTPIKFDNCIYGGNDIGTVDKPSYEIDEIPVGQVVNALTNSSCGAGATLLVSTKGIITTSCPTSLTKQGSGSSKQTVNVNQSIKDFQYTWKNATSVIVTGMPPGVNVKFDDEKQKISISGSPSVPGIYKFKVKTVGGSSTVKKKGTMVVAPIGGRTLTLQENSIGFCGVEGRIENENEGFTGSGFANTDNENGKGIEWTIDVPSAGNYDLLWRYANGDSGRRARLKINGKIIITDISMPSTGSWTNWKSTPGHTAKLSPGKNIIRLEAKNPNGLANIDYLRIKGDGLQLTNCEKNNFSTIKIEENAPGFCRVDGTIDMNNSGFTGSGFANADNDKNEGIKWSINVPKDGIYYFVWRYANKTSSNRKARLEVNGTTTNASINFKSTGSWNSWTITPSQSVYLKRGNNEIYLRANNSAGLANIDYIKVTGISPQLGSCNGKKGREENHASFLGPISTEDIFNAYPNPVETSKSLNIQLLNPQPKGGVKVFLFDLHGIKVASYTFEAYNALSLPLNLPQGVYILRVEAINSIHEQKIIVK